MLSLQEKVLQLKLNTALAARYAAFWEKAIETHGAEKATAFYSHLGLNHLEKKSYDYEGLTLSREPKDHEKLCVKGIAIAQEAGKASVATILLSLRSELIDEALTVIKKLSPADYHTLILSVPETLRTELRDNLGRVFQQGRLLVRRELERQQGKAWQAEGTWQHPSDFDFVHKRNGFGPHDSGCIRFDCKCSITHEPTCALKNGFPTCSCEVKAADQDEFDELDDLTDLTDSRVVNDVQTRISASAARFALLGLTGAALWKAVRDEMNAGSVSYIDRAAQGVANRVLNMGRSQEAEDRRDEWERVEYSALLDANVCDPCAADDGQEAANEDDLTPTPNPDCAGSDLCRCVHIFIAL